MTTPFPEHIAAALRRYADGQATPEDKRLIEAWNNSFDDEMPMPDEVEAALGRMGIEVHERLLQAIHSESGHKGKMRPLPAYYKWVAAAVFLLAVAAIWVVIHNHSGVQTPSMPGPALAIHPGSSKALLTLSNGQKVVLDTTSSSTITDANGTKILNNTSGQLSYESASLSSGNPVYNTLTTPRGGQFRIILPDGSLVWINAASTLYYPTAFIGPRREITLKGEAYFEIKRDINHPFVVKTNTSEVLVLGTAFNVMTYEDEPSQQMTLVDGSVRVTNKAATKQPAVLLVPGQQASLARGANQFLITRPDLNAVLAWKNGEIRYDGVPVSTIMRQIARWYDVEIAYEGPLPENEFAGVVSRMDDIRELLGVLEDTRSVHFKIEGKKIIVIAGPK